MAASGSDPEEEFDFTQELHRMAGGDVEARNRVFTYAYDTLRQLARSVPRRYADQTLQPTVLVNEAFLRLSGGKPVNWADRQHFYILAARTLRRVLIDYIRKQDAEKSPPPSGRVDLDPELLVVASQVFAGQKGPELIDLDTCLARLEEKHPRHAQVVELHFFGGLSFEEIATLQGVSSKTAQRDWKEARLWLNQKMSRPIPGSDPD